MSLNSNGIKCIMLLKLALKCKALWAKGRLILEMNTFWLGGVCACVDGAKTVLPKHSSGNTFREKKGIFEARMEGTHGHRSKPRHNKSPHKVPLRQPELGYVCELHESLGPKRKKQQPRKSSREPAVTNPHTPPGPSWESNPGRCIKGR